MKVVDIVVVGSGLSGLLFSCAAINLGFSVVIVEKSKEIDLSDPRAITINLKNKKFLEDIGLWNGFEFSPIHDIRVADGDFVTQFRTGIISDEPMGFVVRAGELKKRMLRFIKDSGLAEVNINSEFLSLNRRPFDALAVFVKNQSEFSVECQLCVVACGNKFDFITDNFDKSFYSYGQTALCFDIKHEFDHANSAVEYFFPDGPVAVLPLAHKNESSIVFTTLSSKKNQVVNNIGEEIEKKINYLGQIEITTAIKEYELVLQYVKQYYSERMLLIGNSLHCVHPIAGQGWNLSVQDIKCFYHIMKECLELGIDFSSNQSLLRFQRKRKPCNMAMIAITDITNLTFSSDNFLKKVFRRTMLILTERVSVLKKSQMLVAMGYTI